MSMMGKTEVLDTTTGVRVKNLSEKIGLYHNPVVGNEMTVETDGFFNGTVRWTVYSSTAKAVLTGIQKDAKQRFTINAEDIPHGLYFLKVSVNNATTVIKKAVIQ